MDTRLVRYEAARTALEAARSVDEVKEIHDKAEAVRAYARQANDTELVSWASEIKLRAMRKMGQLLDEMKERGERENQGGDRKSKSATMTLIPALPDLGISRNISSLSQHIAQVPEAEFEAHLEALREEHKEVTVAGVARLVQAADRARRAEGLAAVPLPVGKYRVIYADPPWEYRDAGVITESDNYGRAARHYPTMPLEDICGLAVAEIAAPDSVLFLWVTSPLLEDAFRVIRAWGFSYKASFVWHKMRHNFGHYNSMRHEFLLIATQGSCLPDSPKLVPSVVEVARGEHSEKPGRFREIIDELYMPPKNGSDRIELFARGEAPENWTVWGNQA